MLSKTWAGGAVVLAVAASAILSRAPQAAGAAAAEEVTMAALLERLAALEKRVTALEQRPAPAAAGQQQPPPQASPELAANRAKAQARMRADRQTYKQEELGEVEALYQPSNDRSQRGSPMVKASLEKLIAQYPKSNRAGCAVLYLAQWAQGAEREKLLTQAFEKHDDAYYGDGCQVGPYARFQLAQWYDEQKQPEKAKALRDELRKKYANATDHAGVTLVSQLPKE